MVTFPKLKSMQVFMFTPEILTSINSSVLCWLATVDAHGQPSVSPKEVFCAHGASELLIANIASPHSANNIRAQSQVCVSFLDIFAQKGHKLFGQASVITPSSHDYSGTVAPLLKMVGPRFPIQSVFKIIVTQAQQILAPSYRLIPGTTDESQRQSAYRTYGVTPLNKND
jgi:uncharacterized protein